MQLSSEASGGLPQQPTEVEMLNEIRVFGCHKAPGSHGLSPVLFKQGGVDHRTSRFVLKDLVL